MFGDGDWIDDRANAQEERFGAFLARHVAAPMVVLEIGAGSAVATIRHLAQDLGHRPGCLVVRINPREAAIAPPHLGLATGALAGLTAIDALLAGAGGPP
jgi:hypothetical protein